MRRVISTWKVWSESHKRHYYIDLVSGVTQWSAPLSSLLGGGARDRSVAAAAAATTNDDGRARTPSTACRSLIAEASPASAGDVAR